MLNLFVLLFQFSLFAQPSPSKPIKKVVVVVLENTSYKRAIKMPFLAALASQGASLERMHAVTHPSQPNYIALTSGKTWGVRSNDEVNLDDNVKHLGDLLENKGLDWRLYAEGYPGDCFLKAFKGKYVRKHVPFLSYKSVQSDPVRCAKIVNARSFAEDAKAGSLPAVTFYIPDDDNNGHDTGVAFADKRMKERFEPLLTESEYSRFRDGLLFIVTFDENDYSEKSNQIYTTLWGESVVPGAKVTERHDLYSLLRLIEDLFELGGLGANDSNASRITGIWK